METKLYLDINPQPDANTCGPTCLHAIYRYFSDEVSLSRIVSEVRQLKGGGTLAVYLGSHALNRGYKATIYTYNLQIFDPTWFSGSAKSMEEKLRRQVEHKKDLPGLETATQAYLEFLRQYYEVGIDRLLCAIMLGVLSYDGDLLIIEPRKPS